MLELGVEEEGAPAEGLGGLEREQPAEGLACRLASEELLLQRGGDVEQLDELGARELRGGHWQPREPLLEGGEQQLVVAPHAELRDVGEEAEWHLDRRIRDARRQPFTECCRAVGRVGVAAGEREAGAQQRQDGGKGRQLATGQVDGGLELGARIREVAAVARDAAEAPLDAGSAAGRRGAAAVAARCARPLPRR